MGVFLPLPIRVPAFLKGLYPNWYVWDKKSTTKTLYLTFDDGPIPEVTEWVLSTLSRKRIPATFFCIGDNVRKHPEIFNRILAEGHKVGNHTFNHLKGWETDTETYIENTLLCEETMCIATGEKLKENAPHFPLFRPPYGKPKRKQARLLKEKGFEIIMYRVVAYDWEDGVSREQCLQNVTKHSKSGDLVVFHDSVKAQKNMQYALPKMIDYFLEKGYTFKTL